MTITVSCVCFPLPQMAPDYDHLTLMQKVEVFEHALEHTNGDDLAKILWFKSPSSEVGVRGCYCINYKCGSGLGGLFLYKF